jgi:hypothetical protein
VTARQTPGGRRVAILAASIIMRARKAEGEASEKLADQLRRAGEITGEEARAVRAGIATVEAKQEAAAATVASFPHHRRRSPAAGARHRTCVGARP